MEGTAAYRGDQPHQCICITGMHRTGTSLVAGLLHRHGLWLGDEADMMPANPYNPYGYFENDRLVEINDAILALFGGGWSSPPDFPAGWTGDARLAGLYEGARARGELLAGIGRPWGFKDPRAALTLPFWRSAWGQLTMIVTIRNPLDTARSLSRRDDLTLPEGVALWSAYYRSLLEHTTPATRIVVEYEALCADPVRAAAALLSRLPGLDQVDPDAARASVRTTLRHYHATLADLLQAEGIAGDVPELYAQLQSEAIHPDLGAEEMTLPAINRELAEAIRGLPATLSGLDLAIRDVHVDLQRVAAVVARLEGEIGLIRNADLAGVAAPVQDQHGNGSPIEKLSAKEAAVDVPVNGRRD